MSRHTRRERREAAVHAPAALAPSLPSGAPEALKGLMAHVHRTTGLPLLLALVEPDGRVRTVRVGCDDALELEAIALTVLGQTADAFDRQAVYGDDPAWEEDARRARAASAVLSPGEVQ